MTTVITRVATLTAVLALGAAVSAHDGSGPEDPPGPPPFMIQGPFGPEIGGRVVAGRPYSAQTVTEMTQTLADGNRIVERTEGAVYRDGEGRTRREHTFTGMGPLPFGAAMRGRQVITIDDVVAGVQYALDPQAKEARQMRRWNGRPPEGLPRRQGGPGDRMGLFGEARGGSASATESLGTRTIEGLEAEGTRTTITIPAGEAGNEMPLEIVSERWVSNELQVSVLMRFVDPRMGERIHRLTSIARGEPSPQLFVVPADFKTVDGPERLMHPQRVP